MKRIITFLVLVLCCIILFACDNTPKNEKIFKITGPETVEIGAQTKYELEISGYDNTDLYWFVDNETYASIDNGTLTGLKEGNIVLAVMDKNSGTQATLNVAITSAKGHTKNLVLTGSNVCKIGSEITLNVSYDKDTTVNLVWSSGDEKIAKVVNGVVEGIAKGSVTITVTDTLSQLTKSIVVKIESDVVTIDDMLDWAFEQSGTESLDDVNLPIKNEETGATFVWSTDSPDLLNIAEGYVEFTEIDQIVKLTCEATFNGETKSRTIDFTVLGYAAYDVYREFMTQFKGNQVFKDMTDMERSYSLFGGSTVEIESHNKAVFDNNGKLNKSFYDTDVDVTLHIKLTNPSFEKDIDVTLIVKAMDMDERKAIIEEWINKNVSPDGYIYKTTVIPTHIDDYDVDLVWLSQSGGPLNVEFSIDNPILGDNLGVIINMTCKDNSKNSLEKSFKVALTQITDPWEKIDLFVNTIASTQVEAFSYLLINWTGYSTGYVPFVTEAELPIIQDILPYTDGNTRTGIMKRSTQYVVVHDTGSPSAGADATMHNNYIKSLNANTGEDRVVSWHFTIDDKLCYQHLPLDEVAWHAGDGSHVYGDVYYNSTYKKEDCIGGGNYNGIGIESCVHNGTDYTYTMRRLAKLVASLLVKYNLGIDRVKQHWHFSGKNCPQVMRESHRWNELIYLIKLEYYLMTELKGAKLEWTSLTPDLMDNEGRIIGKQPNGTTVSYKVKVTYDGTSKEYTFSNKLSVR